MRRLSPEQLVLIAVFLLLPLFNFLITLRRRWRVERPGAAQVEPDPATTRAEATSPRFATASRNGPPHGRPRREPPAAPARQAPPAERLPGGRRLKVRARLGPPDARRAMVLMAIFGPCRALEPPHSPDPEPRRSGTPSSPAR